jgi:SAM-dependent methyltransferase
MDTQAHWENVYRTRGEQQTSWYRPRLDTSLALIDELGLGAGDAVIDVGSVDEWLARGMRDVTALDVSGAALADSRTRLGERAAGVKWVVSNVLAAELPAAHYALWHDRAVFHFLVASEDRAHYIERAARAVRPGGRAVIATFALDGPERCSGLDVCRYDAVMLARHFSPWFALDFDTREEHVTPSGAVQRFTWVVLAAARPVTTTGGMKMKTTGKIAAGILAAVGLATSGCAGGSDMDGMYMMTRAAFGSLSIEAYRFEDGNVVRNPLVPGDSLDVEAERKLHANDVGTFEVDGDEMTMTFGGSPSKSEVERDGDCFMWDMGTFCRVEPFDDDTLEGTFSGGASARGSSGIAMNSRTIVFADDGTYTMESASSVSSLGEGTNVAAGSSGAEKGEYEIDGTVIRFRPEGGEERVLTAFPYDDGTEGEKPRRIFLGGTMLKRN